MHESGYREVTALDVGEAETEAFWRSFLRGLVERGLAGVQPVVSDAHAALKKAIAQVLGCPWQRCSIHFLRTCSSAPTAATRRASSSATRIARLRAPLPKLRALLEEAEEDRFSFYSPNDQRSLLFACAISLNLA